jgi:hypothetical protein
MQERGSGALATEEEDKGAGLAFKSCPLVPKGLIGILVGIGDASV